MKLDAVAFNRSYNRGFGKTHRCEEAPGAVRTQRCIQRRGRFWLVGDTSRFRIKRRGWTEPHSDLIERTLCLDHSQPGERRLVFRKRCDATWSFAMVGAGVEGGHGRRVERGSSDNIEEN